jgi:hypothetical protein
MEMVTPMGLYSPIYFVLLIVVRAHIEELDAPSLVVWGVLSL